MRSSTIYLRSLPDSDPTETRGMAHGAVRHCCKVFEHARSRGLEFNPLLNTPYCNTIVSSDEPVYPGDLELERRINAIVRWNALGRTTQLTGAPSQPQARKR